MASWKKIVCANPDCKHKFTLHAPECTVAGCPCLHYTSKSEQLTGEPHKISENNAVLKQPVVYDRRKQKKPDKDAIASENPYVRHSGSTSWGAWKWRCRICKKSGTWAQMIRHFHPDAMVRIKKPSKSLKKKK